MEKYEIRYYYNEATYRTGNYAHKEIFTSRVAAVYSAQIKVKNGYFKFFDVHKIED